MITQSSISSIGIYPVRHHLPSCWHSSHCTFFSDRYVADLSITSDNAAGNTDGIHPDATRNMLVERVTVAVGDDAVAITSGEMYVKHPLVVLQLTSSELEV